MVWTKVRTEVFRVAKHLGPSAPPPPSNVGEAVAALMGLGVAEVNARRVTYVVVW